MSEHVALQVPAYTMLEQMQEICPKATLHDLERALRAQRKRDKRAKRSAAMRYLDVAIAEVCGERAMIQARRAALPRLHSWLAPYREADDVG